MELAKWRIPELGVGKVERNSGGRPRGSRIASAPRRPDDLSEPKSITTDRSASCGAWRTLDPVGGATRRSRMRTYGADPEIDAATCAMPGNIMNLLHRLGAANDGEVILMIIAVMVHHLGPFAAGFVWSALEGRRSSIRASHRCPFDFPRRVHHHRQVATRKYARIEKNPLAFRSKASIGVGDRGARSRSDVGPVNRLDRAFRSEGAGLSGTLQTAKGQTMSNERNNSKSIDSGIDSER